MCMIKNHEDKFNMVLDQLEEIYSKDEFTNKFKEMFPDDWKLIQDRYNEHKKKSKGKWHPCPHPRQYILNVSHKIRKEGKNLQLSN